MSGSVDLSFGFWKWSVNKQPTPPSFMEKNSHLLIIGGAIGIAAVAAIYCRLNQKEDDIQSWQAAVQKAQEKLSNVEDLARLNNADWHVPTDGEIEAQVNK